MPETSVVMSVFNGEKFLADSISSILNQTYSDFEFIIINDGSTDRSESIISRFGSQDSRIRLISRENKGLAASLNEGIEISQGKYIARMDADDVAVKSRLELQVSAMKRLDVDVLGGAIRYMEGKGHGRIEEYPLTDADIKFRMLLRSPLAHPTVLAKSDVLKGNRYSTKVTRGQDYELWTRLAMIGCRFGNIPDVCLLYRTPPQGVVQATLGEQFDIILDAAERYGERMYGLPKPFMRGFRTGFRLESIEIEDAVAYSVTLAKIGADHGVMPKWVEKALFGIARRAYPSGTAMLRALSKIRGVNPRAVSARLTLLCLFKVLPFSSSRTLIKALKG